MSPPKREWSSGFQTPSEDSLELCLLQTGLAKNEKLPQTTSLNKVFVSKYLLVIFLLLFFHSFRVASDFSVNPINLHIHFEIRYASAFADVRKNSVIFIFNLSF